MTQAEFFNQTKAYLASTRPTLDHNNLSSDANLWEMGYITSLSAVELIMFVETLIARPITITDMRTFDSIASIYRHYVEQPLPL